MKHLLTRSAQVVRAAGYDLWEAIEIVGDACENHPSRLVRVGACCVYFVWVLSLGFAVKGIFELLHWV